MSSKSYRRCIFFLSILNTVSVLQRGVSNTIMIPFTIILPGSETNIKVPSNWYDNCNFLGFSLSAIIASKTALELGSCTVT